MPKASCPRCAYVYFWAGNPLAIFSFCPICTSELTAHSAPSAWPKVRIFDVGTPIERNGGKFERYLATDSQLTLGHRCDFCGRPAEARPVHVAFPKTVCHCSDRENEGLGDES